MAQYTVRPGDTLSGIAQRYGMTWRELYHHGENAAFRSKRPDPNRIQPGDDLWVPGDEPPPQPEPPPEPPPGPPPVILPAGQAVLYDMFWGCPLPVEEAPTPVELTSVNTLDRRRVGVPAAILFPATLTPDILVGDAKVELLLLCKDGADLQPQDVNRHLKIRRGLDPAKSYLIGPLFDREVNQKIKVKKLGNLSTETLKSESRFAGRVQHLTVDLYKRKGFTNVWSVTVDKTMLDAADRAGAGSRLNVQEADGSIAPPQNDDNQDHFCSEAVKNGDLERDGKFGFQIAGDDAVAGRRDSQCPVQLYHPLFYFAQLNFANMGHMADIHVSSRQQLLAKCSAHVVEMPGEGMKSIGEMVNVCSRDTKAILDAFAGDQDVQVVLLGGDLVDFIRNIYHRDATGRFTVKDIWNTVDMEGKAFYHDSVDFLTVFALLVDFYKGGRGKPVYAITGNHDCYAMPYGISPRVPAYGRANEGIPADHNLTIYEAILSFGKTYGQLSQMSSGFDAAKLAWFYHIYTPFSDFTLQLPKQYVVGLGWGDDETMITVAARSGGQGHGHLPRAPNAISDEQLSFLRKTAVDKNDGRKVLLTTHFTLVSYKEDISNADAARRTWGDENDQGDVYYTSSWYSTRDFAKADMGTFELNREPMYSQIIARQRKIQVVFTGHSHRRGFYTARRIDESGNNSVKTGFHDFPSFTNGVPALPDPQDRQEPWIILSDSGGSIPRYNNSGEFKGFGSDNPAGSKVVFNDQGGVALIAPIRTSVKPRLAVSLDYLDLLDAPLIKGFQTDELVIGSNWPDGPTYEFNLNLSDEIVSPGGNSRYGLSVQSMDLYYLTRPGGNWSKIPLTRLNASRWRVPGEHSDLFRLQVATNKTRGIFLSVKFASQRSYISDRYDLDTPWTFEIQIKNPTWGNASPWDWTDTKQRFVIERDADYAEIPDLDRRDQYPEYSR